MRLPWPLLLLLLVGQAQPLGQGGIFGKVVDENGEPVRKAVVTLTLEGTPQRWATWRTDSSGRFSFENLPAGKYELRATKESEGTAIYGANNPRELGDAIVLAAGEMRADLVLRMFRPASITGHVYDSEGDPVGDASVAVLQRERNLGEPILANANSATTDDRGEYHIEGLEPGQYYLTAVPARSFVGVAGTGVLVPQYYRGATEEKDATMIRVRSGESLADVDFHLTSEPLVELRGQVVGVPEGLQPSQSVPLRGNPDLGVQVRIRSVGEGLQTWSLDMAARGPEYRFQLAGIAPGRYRIDAELHAGSVAYGTTPQIVDLRTGAGEVLLQLVRAVDIHGSLKIDGQLPPERERGDIRVQLARRDGMTSGYEVVPAKIEADGRFVLPQVLPGEWQLGVNPLPPGYVKAATLGDQDIRFSHFEISPQTEAALNVIVSMNTAAIEGQIDSGESDSRRAGIVLAPLGANHDLARFYYAVDSDVDGRFKLTGIAPGKYRIFALEKMSAESFRNPEAAERLGDIGKVIDVAEGTKLELHPKPIPAARAAKALE